VLQLHITVLDDPWRLGISARASEEEALTDSEISPDTSDAFLTDFREEPPEVEFADRAKTVPAYTRRNLLVTSLARILAKGEV